MALSPTKIATGTAVATAGTAAWAVLPLLVSGETLGLIAVGVLGTTALAFAAGGAFFLAEWQRWKGIETDRTRAAVLLGLEAASNQGSQNGSAAAPSADLLEWARGQFPATSEE